MATILSGGNGIPSFEEWKKKGGGTAASSSRPNSRKTVAGVGKAPVSIGARLTEELLGGGEGVPSFEEWSKLRHSDASPVLSEPKSVKKGIFDTSDRSYADDAGMPYWNREEIDDGAQVRAEKLRAIAEKNDYQAARKSPEELAKLNRAVELHDEGARAESGKLETATRKEIRERQKLQKATAGRLRDEAYYAGQEGIRNVGERLAASDPEFLSKARAGYEKPAKEITLSSNSITGLNPKNTTIELPNPIQAQRSKVGDDFKGIIDGYAPVAATLDEQLDNIDKGLRTQTGVQNMGGVNLTDMTADELKTYSYWYNRSPHAAKRYLESIAADVNARTAERESEHYARSTREERDKGVLNATGAVIGQLAMDTYTSPLALASVVGSKITGKPYDPNSSLNRAALMGSSMQEGLTGDLPTFGKFLADTGLSTAQFLARIPLGAAGLVVMASGAGGKTANEVRRNGGTTDQALMLGTIAGIAEYASEKIPFENIAAAFKGMEKKGLVKLIENGMKKITSSSLGHSMGAVVGSTLEEGLEELITEYVNNIANDAIMGDDSEMKKYARELVESGMDYEEACRTAFNQFYVTNPLVSFAGGALSGAVMTGAGEAWHKRGEIGRAAVNTVGKALDSTFNPGMDELRTRIKNNTQNNVKTDAQVTQDGVSGTQNTETDIRQENVAQTQKAAWDEAQVEPMVTPKDEQFDENGNFVLKTAEQEDRIRRAKASNDDIERSGRLAGASDSEIKLAQSLSKVFGRNIIFDSTNANVNGKFADGTIYVNPKGTDNVSTILAHELTHSLEGTSEYENFKSTLKRSLIDQGKSWDSLMDQIRSEYEPRYESMGQEFTDADCESETIARAMQAAFNDDASIDAFVKQNRNVATRFWHKLTQAVKRFREDISARWEYDHGMLDENERAAQFALRQMEDLRDRFAKALVRTKENFGESRNATVQYSQAVDHDFLDFIKECENSTDGKIKRYNISDVSERQARELKNLTGEDFSEYKNSINSDTIKHIKKRHGENGEHDTTMSNDLDIARVGYVLKNFDSVEYLRDKNGNIEKSSLVRNKNNELAPLVEYRKRVGDTFVVVQAIADNSYKKLWVRSAYMTKNGVTQESNVQSTDSTLKHTSETNLASPPSDNSISHSGENVNSTEKENSGKTEYSLANSALARAKQMEAEDESPFAIKEATGWYRDNEGKWKKEWRKGDDMFDAELPKTEKSADGGLNEALSKPTAQKNSEMDEITQKAKNFFGITYDWNKTGYLLTDGSQLDFSGKHEGYDSGMRSVDHREIENIYDNAKIREDAMNDFLAKGNIRIMPEGNSINLSVEPNTKQETALRRYINRVRGEVTIDIDDSNGNTVKSLEYDSGTSAAKILSDIHDYFENGSGSQSDIAMFHNMGDQYSVGDDDYGTKAINTAEEINRKKALAMLKRGKDPQYVFQLTGWFYDDFGNFMVNHGAEVYSYGGNETDSETKLRSENENLRKQNDDLMKGGKSKVSDRTAKAAYERGVKETQQLLKQAADNLRNSDPQLKTNPKYIRKVVSDLLNQPGTIILRGKKRSALTESVTKLYNMMADMQSRGENIWGNKTVSDEVDKIATEIQDNWFSLDEDVDAEREAVLKWLKTPMYVSDKLIADFQDLNVTKINQMTDHKLNLRSSKTEKRVRYTKDENGNTVAQPMTGTRMSVDTAYQELTEVFPQYFPADIWNESERLNRIIEVANMFKSPDSARHWYYNFSGYEEAYKNDHSDLVVRILEGYMNREQAPKTWADRFIENLVEPYQKMEQDHAKEAKKALEQAEIEITSVLASTDRTLSEYQEYMNKRIKDVVDDANRYKDDNDRFYVSRVHDAYDDANRRVKDITNYYESREKARLDREAEQKAAREQRRHDRGGDISAEKIDAALDDGTFTGKMMMLYDKAKQLSTEYSKFANVDLEELSPETQKIARQARDQLDNINSYINKVHQVLKKVRRDKALNLIATGDIMSWKNKKSGLLYGINTMVRNVEDISKGDALGQQIIKEYIEPVHRHEAMKLRFLNSMRERVKSLDLATTVADGNKLSESAFVQLLGECRSNIEMLEDGNGNAVNLDGMPIREGKTLEDWRSIQTQILMENQNMDMNKIDNAITVFHAIYNELFEALNQARVTAGYAPVEYHAGYFPHFNNQSGTDGMLASLMNGLGLSIDGDGLPTSINGLTHTFRPGIKYMSNVKQRSVYGVGDMYNGFVLTSGAVEGFDRYIESAADVIYHTEDIQNLRSLSDAIRYSTTDESRKQQIDAIRADSKLTPNEQDSRIGELFENAQHYRLSNFVVNLEDWTNIIAGKKSLRDRQWEQFLGRSMYQGMKKLEQRIAANQIALNPGSWLTNFAPLTQAGSVLTQKQLLNAMWDTVKAAKQSDGFVERSDFLTNRFGTEKLVQTKADKFAKTLGTPMDIIDGFTAETIVRARYAQNLAKNLSETDAMHEADMFAYKLMANRAKGDMPTIFHASNPLWKLFTQYQLEVNNGIMFMLKDLPKEAKARDPEWTKELVKMLLKMSIGAWLYNEVYEMFVGRRCVLDPINIFNDFAGDLTGYKAPGIADVGDVIIGKKDWHDIAKSDQKDVVTAVGNLASNVRAELPFIGGVMSGGGRIPVQSALPSISKIDGALTGDKALSKRVETIGKELAKPAAYILPPFGGGQIKKAIEGTAAYIQGGSYTRDNDGKKKLQYPVENKSAVDAITNLPRAVLFGKTANKYGREWVDDGFGSLSAKATTAYEALVKDGVGQDDAYKHMKEFKALTADHAERADKVAYLREIDCSSEAKRTVFEQMILSSDDSIASAKEKLDSLEKANIKLDYYLDAYETYLRSEGDAKKVNLVNKIQASGLTSDQKDVLYCCFYREKGLPDTPWHNGGVKKVMANEDGIADLPKITMPEISMPEIRMPEINMPKLK